MRASGVLMSVFALAAAGAAGDGEATGWGAAIPISVAPPEPAFARVQTVREAFPGYPVEVEVALYDAAGEPYRSAFGGPAYLVSEEGSRIPVDTTAFEDGRATFRFAFRAAGPAAVVLFEGPRGILGRSNLVRVFPDLLSKARALSIAPAAPEAPAAGPEAPAAWPARAGETLVLIVAAVDAESVPIPDFALPECAFRVSARTGTGESFPVEVLGPFDRPFRGEPVTIAVLPKGAGEVRFFVEETKTGLSGASDPIPIAPGAFSRFRLELREPPVAGRPVPIEIVPEDAFGNATRPPDGSIRLVARSGAKNAPAPDPVPRVLSASLAGEAPVWLYFPRAARGTLEAVRGETLPFTDVEAVLRTDAATIELLANAPLPPASLFPQGDGVLLEVNGARLAEALPDTFSFGEFTVTAERRMGPLRLRVTSGRPARAVSERHSRLEERHSRLEERHIRLEERHIRLEGNRLRVVFE